MFRKIRTNLFGRKKAKVTEYERKMLEEELLNKLFDFNMVYFVSIDPRDKAKKDLPGKERPDLIEKLKRRYKAFVSDRTLELYDKTNELNIYQTNKDPHEDTRYECHISFENDKAIVEAYLNRNGKKDCIFRSLKMENPSAIILYRKGISWITDGYLTFKGAIREGKEYHNEITAIVLFGEDKIGVIRNSGYIIK